MYDDFVKRLRDFAVELRKAEDALLVRDAADAIEELAAFKAQITDGHFYCMRDGVLYAAKYETPKAKSIQSPPTETKLPTSAKRFF